ncbi:glycerophosphoryl diester phosphodiesterase [Tepiditoga spiralis]|uniref:Glycerophosphoryl diester phosphodiesterase n=1 Tax=Tepiditoga spiralis TaxID=2108365 RepID=A0A7G1G565_9BACT|nr:glycerophosphodiester phosphodiesterase [Tepiditoga spiralis]BBE31708.1 glycerophosphoryl diester phosphodiesterase [Tepiditoga spiralis]
MKNNKKEKYLEIKKVLNIFFKNIYLYISYEIIFKIMSFFIILPIFNGITNYVISKTSSKLFFNNDTFKFFISFQGIITTIILGIIAFIFIYVENAGLIIITYQKKLNELINIKSAIINSLKKLKNTMSLGILQLLLYFLLIVPFLGFGMVPTLIDEYELPTFIEDYIFNNGITTLIYIFVFLFSINYLIKWIFAIHVVVLEDKNFSNSLKRSKELVKGSFWKILGVMLFWQFVILFIIILIIILGVLLITLISGFFGENSIVFEGIEYIFTSLSISSTFLISIFTVPLNMIVITDLYFKRLKSIKNSEFEIKKFKVYNSKFELDKFIKKHIKIVVFILILTIFFMGNYTFSMEKVNFNSKVYVNAHRGDYLSAPENTISAIKVAVKNKADFAEIDVRLTKDNIVVLSHDSSLKRVADKNITVENSFYKDLKDINVGEDYEFDEKIPTLEEVIEYAKNKIKLNIEIKIKNHDYKLVDEVIKLIKKYKFEHECIITSLDYNALKRVKVLYPVLKTGLIMYVKLGKMEPILKNKNIDVFSMEESQIDKRVIETIHKYNKKIFVWTVNDEESMDLFINLGVDGIITDYTDLLVKKIKEYKEHKDERNKIK